jgi:NodT family efflux transporter outer membrane factor (OMF) lipoprotein
MGATRSGAGYLVTGVLLLAGCTVGPDYHTPDVQKPDRWQASVPAAEAGNSSTPRDDAGVLAGWWKQFHDPKLDELVGIALRDNLDIRTAWERIAQARAQRDVAAGDRWPGVSGTGRAYRIALPDSAQQLQSGQGPGQLPGYLNLFQLGFDSSWELDLFGQTRRAVEAAEASAQAADAARRGVIVSTLAELGSDYLALRASQTRLAIAEHTIEVDRASMELTQSRHRSGMASDLDVAQATAQLQTAQSTPPLLRAQILQAIHALAVLLGRLPESMEEDFASRGDVAALSSIVPVVPMGLPSDLLRNRPDIQQAERELASATAGVGQAEAQRFPSISLTAGTSLVSTQLNQLLHRGSFNWDAGASLTAPLFEGGRLAAGQRAAEAAARESVLHYRHTVLQAFAETEDALQSYAATAAQGDALRQAVLSQQLALARAAQLYQAGIGSFIDVLDAQRNVATLEDEVTQSEQQQSTALVRIYKALGGGWQSQELPPSG